MRLIQAPTLARCLLTNLTSKRFLAASVSREVLSIYLHRLASYWSRRLH